MHIKFEYSIISFISLKCFIALQNLDILLISKVTLSIKCSHCIKYKFLLNFIKSLNALHFTVSRKCPEWEQNIIIFLRMGGLLFTHRVVTFVTTRILTVLKKTAVQKIFLDVSISKFTFF